MFENARCSGLFICYRDNAIASAGVSFVEVSQSGLVGFDGLKNEGAGHDAEKNSHNWKRVVMHGCRLSLREIGVNEDVLRMTRNST